jgi:hypothetical protein
VNCRRARPKRRVPVHARTLRDDGYEVYREINAAIHGQAFDGDWGPDDCGVCGTAPKSTRHMDREHGHDRSEPTYGKPRGLACPGDWGCNALMSRLTLRQARLTVAYLERCEAFYGALSASEGA